MLNELFLKWGNYLILKGLKNIGCPGLTNFSACALSYPSV